MTPQGNPVRYLQIYSLLPAASFPLLSGVPVAGYIMEAIAIFGIIFLAFRRDWLWLSIGAIVSLLITVFLYGGDLFIIVTWARVAVPAAAFGLLWASGGNPSRAFAVAAVLAVAAALVIFWSERDLINQILEKAKNWLEALAVGDGINPEEKTELSRGIGMIFGIMKRLMPSFLALSVIFQLLAGWLMVMIILHQIGEFVPRMAGFYFWKMPDYYLFLMGGALLVRLLAGETLKIIADNIILFLGMFYAAFGFSVFEYYLKKVRLSLFMRIVFYIGIILLQVPGLILAALVGLFDSYFDFRKVKARMIG